VPGEVVGEKPPKPGAHRTGKAEDRSEKPSETASLPGGEQDGEGGEGQGKKRPASDALHPPEEDQLGHVLAKP